MRGASRGCLLAALLLAAAHCGLVAGADVLVLQREWIPSGCADPQICTADFPDAFRTAGLYLAVDSGAAPEAQAGCEGGGGLKKSDLQAAGVPLGDLQCALYSPAAGLKSQQAGWRQLWDGQGRCTAADSAAAYLAAALELDQAFPLPQDLPETLSGSALEAALAAAFGARPYLQCSQGRLLDVSLCFSPEAISGAAGGQARAPRPAECPWPSPEECGGQLEVPRGGQGAPKGCDGYYKASPLDLKALQQQAAPAPAPSAAAAAAAAAAAPAASPAAAPSPAAKAGALAAGQAAGQQQAQQAPTPAPAASAASGAAGAQAAAQAADGALVAGSTQAVASTAAPADASSGSGDGSGGGGGSTTSTGAMVGALLGGIAAGIAVGGAALWGAYALYLKRRRAVQGAAAAAAAAAAPKKGSFVDLEKGGKASSGSGSPGSTSSWSDGDSGGAAPPKRLPSASSGGGSSGKRTPDGAAPSLGPATMPPSPSLPRRQPSGSSGAGSPPARSPSLQPARGSPGSPSPSGSLTSATAAAAAAAGLRPLQRSRSGGREADRRLLRSLSEGTATLQSHALSAGVPGSPSGSTASAVTNNPLWWGGPSQAGGSGSGGPARSRSLGGGWTATDNPLSEAGSGSGSGDGSFEGGPERSRLSARSLASLGSSSMGGGSSRGGGGAPGAPVPGTGAPGGAKFLQRAPSRGKFVPPPKRDLKFVQPVRAPPPAKPAGQAGSPTKGPPPRTPSKLDRLYSNSSAKLPAVDEQKPAADSP